VRDINKKSAWGRTFNFGGGSKNGNVEQGERHEHCHDGCRGRWPRNETHSLSHLDTPAVGQEGEQGEEKTTMTRLEPSFKKDLNKQGALEKGSEDWKVQQDR